MTIQQGLKLFCVHLLVAQEVQDNPRIKIAAARAHGDASSGGKTHRRIYGTGVLDGRKAGSISQVGDYDSVRGILAQRLQDGFIR